MANALNSLTVLLLLMLSMPCAAPSQTKAEQTAFSAEDDGVKHPVKVPDSLIRILAQSDALREFLKDLPGHGLPPEWLSASEIHLAPAENDLVVMGTGQLRGANVTTFWIFAPVAGGFNLLLEAVGHDLIVKNSRSNGYRDISILAATAVELTEVRFKYEGKGYRKARAKVEKVR